MITSAIQTGYCQHRTMASSDSNSSDPVTKGRLRRRHRSTGQARREALLRAAIDVIAAKGAAAVTHRAVTEAAGVPLATASYFFDSINELTAEAIQVHTTRRVQELQKLTEEAASASLGNGVDRAVAENRLADRAQILAMVEVYLYAARNSDRRELAAQMLASFEALAADALRAAGAPSPEPMARSFVALVDGYSLNSMASADQQVPIEDLNEAFRAMFLGYLLQQGHIELAMTLATSGRQETRSPARRNGP